MTDNVIDFRAWATARSKRRHPSTSSTLPVENRGTPQDASPTSSTLPVENRGTPQDASPTSSTLPVENHRTRGLQGAPPTRIGDHSPAALWRADFEIHADQHANVTTSGTWVLAPVVEAALRHSLPIFQVGEIGTGSHLLDTACGTVSEDHLQALRLFVIESQEHARLLALMCSALDIDMLDEHWTEQTFRRTRYLRGFRVEMLTIVIAGLISAQMYEVFADGVGDPVLSQIFHRLIADELRHLEFHAATLPDHVARWSRAKRGAARTAWFAAAIGATAAVAWEHRKTLRACGWSPRRFSFTMWQILRAQGKRFFPSDAD